MASILKSRAHMYRRPSLAKIETRGEIVTARETDIKWPEKQDLSEICSHTAFLLYVVTHTEISRNLELDSKRSGPQTALLECCLAKLLSLIDNLLEGPILILNSTSLLRNTLLIMSENYTWFDPRLTVFIIWGTFILLFICIPFKRYIQLFFHRLGLPCCRYDVVEDENIVGRGLNNENG